GREVMIKAVPKTSPEVRIIQHLTSPPLRDFTQNHTIPVVSVILHHQTAFIVQARW
ncbi:hypothetical protein DFH07DRAFT_701148, partial [Mycena maculata]